MRDDKAQMMVLESIFFGITVAVALAFLIQISPTAIQSGTQTSNELKILGDGALDALYTQTMHIKEIDIDTTDYKTNNPTSKLAVCFITNNYASLITSLNEILPPTVLYNIYISNGTKTVFWCSSTFNTIDPLPMIDPIAISHHPIPIDPKHLSPKDDGGYTEDTYLGNTQSDIWDDFIDVDDPYNGATYDVILEMSYT